MARSVATTWRWCRSAAPTAAAAGARAAIPQAEVRRDYELALQIGNKDALNAFLAQYPDGFYANLAKLQLDKMTAEEARVAATEKARPAEQERARLAAEGAQKDAQAEGSRRTQRRPSRRGSPPRRPSRRLQQQRRGGSRAHGCRQERQASQRAVRPAAAEQPQRHAAGDESRRAERRAAAGRCHQIGADRIAPRRLPDRSTPMATGTSARNAR